MVVLPVYGKDGFTIYVTSDGSYEDDSYKNDAYEKLCYIFGKMEKENIGGN